MTKYRCLEGLSWLHDEVVVSLGEAVATLAAYQETRQVDSLEHCRALLQQIRGGLQVADCKSGMLLLTEMLHTVDALRERPAAIDEGCAVLAQAADTLPRHLVRLQKGEEDHPALLMVLLNDLRAVQGRPLFSDGAYFAPDLSPLGAGRVPPVLDAAEEWRVHLQRLSHFYQAQLIPLLKGEAPQEGVRRLSRIVAPLEALFAHTDWTHLWRAAGGFFEALLSGRVLFGCATRTLLGSLERKLRLAAELGPDIRAEAVPLELMQNLLFYVALAGRGSPRRESLWQMFGLEQSLPTVLFCEQQATLDDDLIVALVSNCSAEVAVVKALLEEYLADDGLDTVPLHNTLQQVHSMVAALTMAGQPGLSALARTVEGLLQQLVVPADEMPEAQVLDGLAIALVELEASLNNWSTGSRQPDSLSGGNGASSLIHGARQRLLQEIGRDVDGLKGMVAEELAMGASTLSSSFRNRLQQLAMILPIAGLPRCARLVDDLGRISQSWQSTPFPALADVLTGLESYLENCREGRESLQAPLLWAEERLASTASPGTESLTHEREHLPVCKESPAGQASEVVSGSMLLEEHEKRGADTDVVGSVAADTALAGDETPEETGATGAGVEFLAEESSDADDELRAVFIEEAREVLETLAESYPRWRTDPSDKHALADTRRAFHTLKGSGRMVEAHQIGEFAWVIESLLNCVMERRITDSPELHGCVGSAIALLPDLIASFERGELLDEARLQDIQECAGALACGDTPALVAQVKPDWMEASPSEEEDDGELIEIFLAEAHIHLDMVRRFCIGQYHCSPACEPPNAMMQSALHTLKGSAHMAGIEPLAQLATTLEQLSRDLLITQTPVDVSSLGVFSDGLAYIEEILLGLAAGVRPDAADARLRDLLNRGEECCRRILASDGPGESPSNESALDHLLHALMGGCLDQLITMEYRFETGRSDVAAEREYFLLLSEELAEAAVHASANGCIPLETLTIALQAAAGRLSRGDEPVASEWVATLLQSREALLRMCDALAANQEVMPAPTELLDALLDIGANCEKPSELAESLRERVAQPGLPDMADREIVELFLGEAEELLEVLEHAFHEWREDAANDEYPDALKRALHTFKGGARMAALDVLADICHELETEVECNERRVFAGDLRPITLMLTYYDALALGVEGSRTQIQSMMASMPVSDPAAVGPMSVETEEPAWPTAEIIPFAGVQRGLGELLPPTGPAAGASQEAVRLAAPVLDLLVNLAGEASISRGQVEQHVNEFVASLDEMEITIRRMHDQVRRLGIETDAQVMFRREQIKAADGSMEFDPLEMDRYSQLQQLARSLLESASDLQDLRDTLVDKSREAEALLGQQARINTDLQEGLMRTRMVSFSRMVPRLRRTVRQVSDALGKRVVLKLDSAEGELDRSILERIVPALEHMARNAIDHGIEPAHERLVLGKPAEGTFSISLAREGSDILIRLADDGRGLNVEAIRAKAIAAGLMSQNASLDDHDIYQFIFATGLSTASDVSEVSGRGVGMDVVYSDVRQLGGSVSIQSRPGVGTEFTVRLPFTLSINRALMIRIKEDAYALPLNTITGVTRIAVEELSDLYRNPHKTFRYDGEGYQLCYLGSLLSPDLQPVLDAAPGQQLPIILMRSEGHRYAVQVDGLQGSQEIVVKTLGPQFSRVPGLSGATVLGDGRVVVILDLQALLREQVATPMPVPTIGRVEIVDKPRVPTVMVVDDSVTVRKVTTRFLEREGFNVLTAKDGIDAMRMLQDHTPDLMLLDIEMPRMDGFEVTRLVRSTQRLQYLPIVMITSRTGEKHRERALSMGADSYLGKPYQEEVLIGVVRGLLQRGRAHVSGGQAG